MDAQTTALLGRNPELLEARHPETRRVCTRRPCCEASSVPMLMMRKHQTKISRALTPVERANILMKQTLPSGRPTRNSSQSCLTRLSQMRTNMMNVLATRQTEARPNPSTTTPPAPHRPQAQYHPPSRNKSSTARTKKRTQPQTEYQRRFVCGSLPPKKPDSRPQLALLPVDFLSKLHHPSTSLRAVENSFSVAAWRTQTSTLRRQLSPVKEGTPRNAAGHAVSLIPWTGGGGSSPQRSPFQDHYQLPTSPSVPRLNQQHHPASSPQSAAHHRRFNSSAGSYSRVGDPRANQVATRRLSDTAESIQVSMLLTRCRDHEAVRGCRHFTITRVSLFRLPSFVPLFLFFFCDFAFFSLLLSLHGEAL